MNERIRELLEQAGYKPLPGFDFANSLDEVFMQKFAELIVQECAKVCDEHKKSLENGWENGLGVASDLIETCESCSTSIKQHFGVE